MRFHVYKDRTKQWRWTLYARNGRKIADSAESYRRHGHCMRMIEKIITGPHRIEE